MSAVSTLRINPLTPSPSHSVSDSLSFIFGVKIFGRSAFDGGTEILFIYLFPPPPPGALLKGPVIETPGFAETKYDFFSKYQYSENIVYQVNT